MKKYFQFIRSLPFALLLLVGGCSLWPLPTVDDSLPLELPQEWQAAVPGENDGSVARLDSFADPVLQQLIAEGLQRNFSLQSISSRVAVAAAQAKAAGAELLPAAELDFSAARRRTQSSGKTAIGNSFSLNGSVSWEPDLWQRLSAGEQAAARDVSAAQADYRAAQLSLAAAIARNWFRLTEADLQLQLAQQTVASYRQSLQVVEEQYRRGLTSALDLRLARSALNNAQADEAERQQLLLSEKRQLELLLGRYPAAELSAARQLPQPTGPIPAGLPSTLLERRPDLQAESLRLQAAGLRSVAAERNRLPLFGLTGSAGTASDRLYRLLDWDYLVWSLAASLTQSLFDGGSKTAEQQLARAQFEQQLADYAEIALTAFGEVEAALSAEDTLKRQAQALQLAVVEAEAGRVLAEQRYRQGLEDIITLQETQRRAFGARSSLLRSERLRLENRIDLHLALGGSLATDVQPEQNTESP